MQRKNRQGRPAASVSKIKKVPPKVGIFFYLENKLFVDATSIEEAENRVGFINHRLGHQEFWADLQSSGSVPTDLEYQDCRRGRIVYDLNADRFFIYLDRCLIGRIRILKEIVSKLGLPALGTRVQTRDDSHYRCPRCIGANLL